MSERIYAIGDVHGCFDLLDRMIARIGAHSAALPPASRSHVIFLGDLVDRGPDSARVLATLYDLQRQSDRVVILAGNHEDAMVQALDGDTDHLRRWMAVGGDDTVRSLGLDRYRSGDDARAYARLLRSRIPREWVGWLRRLPVYARSGDYLFCHAGVRPGVALGRQTRTDLLWIREDFLEDERDHGAVIVHGHSIEPEVTMRANRIGLDTGAYRTGVLSAIYLEGERCEVLEVRS